MTETETPQPSRRGRRPHVPTHETRNTVRGFSACGIPQDRIALYLKIAPKTLRKHYERELETATDRVVGTIGTGVIAIAINAPSEDYPKGKYSVRDQLAASFFILRTRGGEAWRETSRIEHDGKIDGGPVQVILTREDQQL
jgi:hypothetical protein